MATTIFIVFLILKLSGLVSWGWWFVTAPIWCTLLAQLIIAFILFIIAKSR